jgi:hypothetical protein
MVFFNKKKKRDEEAAQRATAAEGSLGRAFDHQHLSADGQRVEAEQVLHQDDEEGRDHQRRGGAVACRPAQAKAHAEPLLKLGDAVHFRHGSI